MLRAAIASVLAVMALFPTYARKHSGSIIQRPVFRARRTESRT